MRLLIPRDLPWLFPYRARWVLAADVLFTVAWSAGLFEWLSSPMEGITVSDRSVIHGLVFGIGPALLVALIPELSTRRMLGVTVASVLFWLLAVRFGLRSTVFILLG